MRLANKVAIVTGGAGGIGRATAIRFAQEGARVAVIDSDREAVEAVLAELHDQGAVALGIAGGMLPAADADAAVERVVAKLGSPDILFNNVVSDLEPGLSLLEISEEAFDGTVEANFKSVWLAIKAVAPRMIAAGGGAIINVASISAFRASNRGAYAASQGAVAAATRVAAAQLGHHNIRVNSLCPGATDGPLALHVAAEQGDAIGNPGEVSFLGRLPTAQDVASTALFLASDDAAAITGASYLVDGGWSVMSGIERKYA